MQFNSQLPPRWSLVPAPDQHCFAGDLVDQVDDAHFLPNYKPLRDNSKAALGTNVLCEAFRTQGTSTLRPLNRNANSRIEPPRATNMLSPLFKFDVFYERHSDPPAGLQRGPGSTIQFVRGAQPNFTEAQNSATVIPYERRKSGSMELRAQYASGVNWQFATFPWAAYTHLF